MGDSGTSVRAMRAFQHSFALDVLPRTFAGYESKGVVYTKQWVVDLLLDLAEYTPEKNLLECIAIEPSAGDGAFWAPMVERLAACCRRLGRSITECSGSLIAFELDEASANRTRILTADILMKYVADRSVAEGLAQTWVRTGDYLAESMHLQADYVVGNPPYVRMEEIPPDVAEFYRRSFATMHGRADLYVAFFEAALRQLKEGGVCAFICADRWMRNQYGAELRDLITAGFSVDILIEMHNANAFHDEVDAYPAITVIRRKTQGATIVASAGPEVANVPTRVLLEGLYKTSSKDIHANGLRAARVETWFQGSQPWPCQSPEQLTLLRHLEERFPTLEANARVGIGVATGVDKVFITKDEKLVEPERMLRLAMADDIRSGILQWSGHYLVDPWGHEGLVPLEKYPRLQKYFLQHEATLKARHTAQKSQRGWYKTIDRVNHSLFEKPKLYIADIKNLLDPVLDKGETYPHHNLYFIQSDVWDLEVLGGLLISVVGQFFVDSYGVRMRGGYLRFQAQYLRRIRVPSPESLPATQTEILRKAFRQRDRELATKIALEVYGIDRDTMEIALGH